MDARDRHDRTARLLAGRLETLARASERSPAGARPFEREIVAVAAATRHAVQLELLSAEEVCTIWSQVARRHPGAGWCAAGFDLALRRAA